MQSSELEAGSLHTTSPIPPFGYHREGNRLVAVLLDGPTRKELYRLFVQHGRKKTVARLLNEAGFRTREGALFSDTTVGRLLRDPIAKGVKDANGEYVVEPLVDEATWALCQEKLSQTIEGKPMSKTPVHLFAGLAVCTCGNKMYVEADKYTCRSCRNKIPATDLERVFFDQFRTCFLSPAVGTNGSGDAFGIQEMIQTWPLMTVAEKRKVVETMLESVRIGNGEITFHVCYLPSAENAGKRQRPENGNKSDEIGSATRAVGKLKINVSARELWEGKTNLTCALNETTRNFLAVLALNVVTGMHVPIELDRDFADGASCTARSGVDILRRQLGAALCKRLLKIERGSPNRPGGVRLQCVEISGTGSREINLDPVVIHAQKSDRTGQSKRQRKPISDTHSDR